MRIGHGYDVHRLSENRKLILGGVEIPHSHGLFGHSDADVLTHAVMDAMLGAMAMGDIGQHFPDTDAKFLGMCSLQLLERVFHILQAAGYAICNIDATIIAQRPKLSPHIPNMRANMAKILQIDTTQINIKATTEEGLGFTGEGAGIAAHAVVLLAEAVAEK